MSDAETIGLGILLTLLLWPWAEHADVILNGGAIPSTPATPSGQTAVMNEIGIWIDPGSGYWWNLETQSWVAPVYGSNQGNEGEGGGNSQEPFMPI